MTGLEPRSSNLIPVYATTAAAASIHYPLNRAVYLLDIYSWFQVCSPCFLTIYSPICISCIKHLNLQNRKLLPTCSDFFSALRLKKDFLNWKYGSTPVFWGGKWNVFVENLCLKELFIASSLYSHHPQLFPKQFFSTTCH